MQQLPQDNRICEKIKVYSKIYSMILEVFGAMNEKFAFTLSLSMLFELLYLILNMLYLMEATASGLFRDDPKRYMYLVMYVVVAWRIAYALTTTFLCAYSNEVVVREAAKTSSLGHEIINIDLSPAINAEMSVQLLHQRPVFTACGLFKVSYELLLEGARTVVTFLVMLLQYAAG